MVLLPQRWGLKRAELWGGCWPVCPVETGNSKCQAQRESPASNGKAKKQVRRAFRPQPLTCTHARTGEHTPPHTHACRGEQSPPQILAHSDAWWPYSQTQPEIPIWIIPPGIMFLEVSYLQSPRGPSSAGPAMDNEMGKSRNL